MKTEEMNLLVRVAEAGSMTRAAEQLGLTPAAVSAAVRRVEAAIGVRVFDRTTRTLSPTAEGLVVLEGCEAAWSRWQATLEAVQGGVVSPTGTVHLSAPSDTTQQVVGGVVVQVAQAHPGLRIVVHPSDTVHHLHRDAIDLAIRYGPLPDSELMARKLLEAPGVLVAAPSYVAAHGSPKTPEALQGHRCLTLQLGGRGVREWRLTGGGRACTVALRSPLCGDGLLARQWAVAGLGIARKSLFDVIDDLEAGRLVRVLPSYQSGSPEVHVVFPGRRDLPARVRVLERALSEAFAVRAGRCAAWLAG